MTKMTKKEMFTEILAILNTVECNEELISGLEHEIELLSNRKPSTAKIKSAEENEALIEEITSALLLIGRAVTITELQKEAPNLSGYSNQKLSAILKKMVDRNLAKKVIDKKKSYFSLAE